MLLEDDMKRIISKGEFVIAPEGCREYLTAGKEYEVIEALHTNSDENYEYRFRIIADDGREVSDLLNGKLHCNYNKWLIKGEKPYYFEGMRKFVDFYGEVYQKETNEKLLTVATQIYCAKTFANVNGHKESLIKTAVEEAKLLIEKCNE